MDSLADALYCINNAKKRSKRQMMLRACSKVIIRFLKVIMKHGYIKEFEVVDDHHAGKIVVNLTGKFNKCGVVSPRFDIALNDIEKWTNNLLPSRQFGKVVLAISGGFMDHEGQGGSTWWKNSGILLLRSKPVFSQKLKREPLSH